MDTQDELKFVEYIKIQRFIDFFKRGWQKAKGN